jgi:hypothetical protein
VYIEAGSWSRSPPGTVHASLPSRRPSPQQLRAAGVLGFGASLRPVSVLRMADAAVLAD